MLDSRSTTSLTGQLALLRTGNSPPSPEETEEIRSLITSHERKIAHFSRAINDLAAQRETLRVEVMGWRTVICSIRRLPPEILSGIFLVWLAVSEASRWQIKVPVGHQVLCQVCSQWRQIAINTPRLWTKRRLSLKSPEVTDDSISTLKELLLRSRPHDIHLRLDTFYLPPSKYSLIHIPGGLTSLRKVSTDSCWL